MPGYRAITPLTGRFSQRSLRGWMYRYPSSSSLRCYSPSALRQNGKEPTQNNGKESKPKDSDSNIQHAPKWEEDKASSSEAAIKAEREEDNRSIEELQRSSVDTVKKKHH